MANRLLRGPGMPGQALAGCIHDAGTSPYDPFQLWTLVAGPPHREYGTKNSESPILPMRTH